MVGQSSIFVQEPVYAPGSENMKYFVRDTGSYRHRDDGPDYKSKVIIRRMAATFPQQTSCKNP